MIFKKRKNEYRNNELPGILIYGWKKKIIEWAWYLFALAFLLTFGARNAQELQERVHVCAHHQLLVQTCRV